MTAGLEDAPRSILPAVNACLNATATVLLVAGWILIRRGARDAHANAMRAAFVASAIFLGCYLWYHFVVVPELGHTPFRGGQPWKSLYYALLVSHVLLAVVNLPMVLATLWLAHKRAWQRHVRLARWTLPIWLYVSVTGVLVYLVLYQWNPV